MPADGSTPTSLGVYPGQQIYSESYHEDNTVYVMPVRHPFGKTTFSRVWGDLAVIGQTETYEIRTFRSDGSLHGIVRREHQPRRPTQADQDNYFRERFADLPEDERTPRIKIAANVPMVETFPAYSDIGCDVNEYLWVAEYERPDDDYDGPGMDLSVAPSFPALGLVPSPVGCARLPSGIGANYNLPGSNEGRPGHGNRSDVEPDPTGSCRPRGRVEQQAPRTLRRGGKYLRGSVRTPTVLAQRSVPNCGVYFDRIEHVQLSPVGAGRLPTDRHRPSILSATTRFKRRNHMLPC